MSIDYLNSSIENGSPCNWEIADDGALIVDLLYDRERASPNRAAGHWHFTLHGAAGTDVRLILRNFDNVWNGRHGSPISDRTNVYVSNDGRNWVHVVATKREDNTLEAQFRISTGTVHVARLEPYRVSDLTRWLERIEPHEQVEIVQIGETVEKRPLEIVRVGRDDAPHRVLIRARSHPWEPGGNWLTQGLIDALLRPDGAPFLERYAVDVLPMAAKDGVMRGHTRFNALGMDLNRDWHAPADPKLAPENAALETWLDAQIAEGRAPSLALDLHNDNSGRLHVSRPDGGAEAYVANMERFESLMREHTWFREGMTGGNFRNPGTFGEGLLARHGIDAAILELNCDWIAGLKKVPYGADWRRLGEGMRVVFRDYFAFAAS
ncbi:MAG: M14 family zinc carboxypeptidase [Candidatus Poribacteria bacterium]|nr:M14 family zinc carboxypeptidase [Candidatus Poribacteria bacterium]